VALKMSWVDKIFERLTIRYGDRFLNRWKGIKLDEVKFDWANVLDGFQNWPDAIAFALENMDDENPPTATKFRALAMKAPRPENLALPAPSANPERVATELSKLTPMRNVEKVDPKAWAKRIIERANSGCHIHIATLNMARSALRMA